MSAYTFGSIQDPIQVNPSAMQDLNSLVKTLGQQRIADISQEEVRRYFILSNIRSRMVIAMGGVA